MPVAAASATNASVTACGYGRVADGVPAAQQHLQRDVRDRLAQRGQPLPGVLGQEPQRDVVGRAAPGLDGQQLRGQPRDGRPDQRQVPGPHPGGQQRLVGVPEGGVGDARDRCCAAQPVGEAFGPELGEQLPGPVRRRSVGSTAAAWLRGSISSAGRRPFGRLTVTSAR